MPNVPLSGLWLFPRPVDVASTPNFTALQRVAPSQKLAFIIQVPRAGNIQTLTYALGTVHSAGFNHLDCRIETITLGTGDPSGTLAGMNSNGVQLLSAADSNTGVATALNQNLTVTQGQLLAFVFATDATLDVDILYVNAGAAGVHLQKFPYSDYFNGAWAKATNAPILGIGYDDGTYSVVPGVYLQGTNATQVVSFGSGNNPNERGINFQLPVGAECVGAWIWTQNTADFTLKLYDSNTNLLTSSVVRAAVHATALEGLYHVLWPTSISLTGLTTYRLTALPSSATQMTYITLAYGSAAQMGAMDGGANIFQTTRNNAGAWTDTLTTRPMFGLILDAVDSTNFIFADAVTARSLWRELTNERNTSVIPDSVVDLYIQMGMKELNERIKYHWSDATITLIAEQQEYTLPPDFVEALHVLWNGIELQRSSMAEWRRNNLRWELEPSQEGLGEWAIYRDKLILRPKPSAAALLDATTVTLRYVSAPPLLSAAGMEQLLSEHQHLPVFKGVAIWSASYPDSMTAQQRMQYYEQAFEKESENARERYDSREVLR